MNNYFVYILYSEKDQKTYIGSTNNIARRINEHNLGKCRSTKYRIPLRLIYKELFVNLSEARVRERYLKSTTGRRELKKILQGIIINIRE